MRYQLVRNRKSDGTLYPRWRIKFFDDEGKYLGQESGTTDKRMTEARAKNRLQEMERDRHNEAMGQAATPKASIRKVIDSYVKAKTAFGGRRGKGWTEETKYKAVSTLEWWVVRLGWKEIKDIRLQDVEAALADFKATGKADNTLDVKRNHLKALTRWATDREILLRDPLRALKRGNIEKKELYRSLSPAELMAVLGEAQGHDYLYMKGGAVSGLRARELCGLKVEWMDWTRGAHLPPDLIGNKAKKPVLAKMPKDYLAELRKFCKDLAPRDFIFRPAAYMNAARMIQGYCELAGVPLRTKAGKVVFHSLRHSFISMINALNPDLKTRLEVSRHDDLGTNLVYSHEDEAAQEQLIEAVSAKLHGNNGVTMQSWKPAAPENKGPEENGAATCISASSDKSRVSNPEHSESPQNRQLHLKGGPRISQRGRKVPSQSSNKAQQLEDIWALVSEEDRQSIVNHGRALLLGLKIHRKGVA